MSVHLLERPGRRSRVEIVRHPEGPVEIKLSGLTAPAERRAQRWRAAAVGLLAGSVAVAALTVAALALRWDQEHRRDLKILHVDLQSAQARARCWEALVRYLPESPQDIIPDARRNDWVRRCVAVELERTTSGR